MGVLSNFFMPKEISGHKIKKRVKCWNCGEKMYIPEKWVPTTTQGGVASNGLRCNSCQKFTCKHCSFKLHAGDIRCCNEMSKGLSAICYLSSN